MQKQKLEPKAIALWSAYALAISIAAYIRLNFIPGVLNSPYTTAYDSDAARYFRLIELISHNYPSLPMFDAFANFPWGMKSQLPPLWAFIEATFALAVGKITGLQVGPAAALFPLFAGFLFCIPAYYATRRLFGKAAGHSAAIVSLFIPVITVASSAGMVDHHLADLLLYMTTIALLVEARRLYLEKKTGKAVILACLAGLAVAFTLLISLSSILVVVILGVAYILGFLLLPEKEREIASIVGVSSLATAGFILMVLYPTTPWFENGLTFLGLSLLQPAVLLGTAALVAVSYAIERGIGNKRVLYLLALYGSIGLVVVLVPQLREQLVQGFYRSIGSYPLGRVTVELNPLFKDGLQEVFFSVLFYVFPVGFAIAIKEAYDKRELDFGVLLFLTWFLLGAFYAIAARYFRHLFIPVAVMAVGLTVSRSAISIDHFLKRRLSVKTDKKLGFAIWLAMLAAICLYLLSDVVGIKHLPGSNRTRMLEWIAANTPETSGYFSVENKPDYGVVASWSLGEMVELVTKRPTLSTANHETGMEGIKTLLHFFQSTSEKEAVDIMMKNKLRYVWLDNEYPEWIGDIDSVDRSGPNPEKIAYRSTSIDNPMMTNVRLYRFFGAGDENLGLEPLQRFRLLNVVSGTGERPSLFFELVRGAKLRIKAEPDAKVIVATRVWIEQGKAIDWILQRKADKNGFAEVTLPYASKDSKYPVAAEDYTVTIGRSVRKVIITEEDAMSGGTIELDGASSR